MMHRLNCLWHLRLFKLAVSMVILLTGGLGQIRPAWSQQPTVSSLSTRIEQLQAAFNRLQQQVQQLAGSADSNLLANQEIRLQELQNELTFVNGQMEELGYALRQLAERLDKEQQETDYRLKNLEELLAQKNGQNLGNQLPGQNRRQDMDSIPPYKPFSSRPTSPTTMPSVPTVPDQSNILPSGTMQSQYDFAFSLLKQGNYEEAGQAFQEFLELYPQQELSGNAAYWLGESYYARKDYQRSAQIFAEGFKNYPGSSKAPDNLLKLALSLSNLGSTVEACATLKVLGQRFPQATPTILERMRSERQRLNCPAR
ncbi:MAG TPA: tol-pal system protein YbgF [Alphaproteobacteria bacterium]|nr:tol-pal system protein YbgF [Alphaproteobacteria bacterium]